MASHSLQYLAQRLLGKSTSALDPAEPRIGSCLLVRNPVSRNANDLADESSIRCVR